MVVDIKLRLVNCSHDVNTSTVVVFQKNVAEDFNELAVAWRVIRNLGFQCSHSFCFPMELTVGAEDAWGNLTPEYAAVVGERWEVIHDHSGDVLKVCTEPARSPEEIELYNCLEQGSFSALVFRDGRLLARKENVSPGQKAVFKFLPKIYLGVVSEISEGDAMDSAILQDIDTEINLWGLRSADIIMAGGGRGADAVPFTFDLANVNQPRYKKGVVKYHARIKRYR